MKYFGQAMILFHDVSKVYRIGENEVRALDHANMRIDRGEFVSVIGPSGSGKSTLMNIIGCLDLASEGEYFLEGQPIEDYSESELAKIRNKKIGFIFQDFNLLVKMTAYENVELPSHLPETAGEAAEGAGGGCAKPGRSLGEKRPPADGALRRAAAESCDCPRARDASVALPRGRADRKP